MGYYRIKNITNKLPKRHVNKDMILNIEYHVGKFKKFYLLKPDNEVVLSCRTLPASTHTLRVKKLITIAEIGENEFNKLQKPSAKKAAIPEPTPTTTQKVEEESTSSSSSKKRKRTTTTTESPKED